ncbi:MAG TPA: glycosyltransferase family 2 protein [Burkholderiaceae bacterium]
MTCKLSICIPTYNRGAYIEETLRSALDQLTDEVEIVVSDNASSDDTQAIVERLAGEHGCIRYFRWDRNMGADANFLKVVEIARGEFCWLMGSDDRIEPGGVQAVLDVLAREPGLAGLTTNVESYDSALRERIYIPPQTSLRADRRFEDAQDCFAMLGPWFGFLSAQIVNRAAWEDVVRTCDLRPYHNAYVHIYVIARMMQWRPAWYYATGRLVGWRSGNDSFLAAGVFKRLSIDVVGYERITGDVFGRDSRVYREVMNAVCSIHVRSALLGAKAKGADAEFFRKALELTVRAYWRYPRFWLRVFPVFCVPRFVLLGARWAYRMTLKPMRLRRLGATR